MGPASFRAELRQLSDGVQIWIGSDDPEGLRGVRDLIDELLDSDDDSAVLSSVAGVNISGFKDLELELVDAKGWTWPIVRSDRDRVVFRWLGNRADWVMCRDLIDGVITREGPGFQWLTGNAGDAAEVLVERRT